MGVGGKSHFPASLVRERDMVPIVQEAGWISGSVSTDTENLAYTEVRTSDRLARGESLHRLRHPCRQGMS